MNCRVTECDRNVLVKKRGLCALHYHRWQRHGDTSVCKPPGFPARPRPLCIFPDCGNLSKRGARGWCGKHYTRWFRHGDPSIDGNKNRKRRDTRERIQERIELTDTGCWMWLGPMLPSGYGYMSILNEHVYTHRAMWEIQYNRQIPDGHDLHHTCFNKGCCNPAHLVPLTPKQHSAAHKEAR